MKKGFMPYYGAGSGVFRLVSGVVAVPRRGPRGGV